MTPFFTELCERFPEQIRSVEELVADQVTVLLNGADVTGIARHFIGEASGKACHRLRRGSGE
jgi:hypothetical protein